MSTNKMAGYQRRLQQFEDVLGADTIDLKALRDLCFTSGCPHEKSIRSRCWKILLNYLPLKRDQWNSELNKQRMVYQQYIEEVIIIPGKKMKSKESASGEVEDHPLNMNPDSEWRTSFNENEMLVQIDKDCRRLCPDLSFFQQATDHPCNELLGSDNNVETLRKRVEHCVLHSETVSKNRLGITINTTNKKRSASDEYALLADGKEAHWEVVERILFIYAILNPGLAYVQGMNEILGPIYYTFATDPDPSNRETAEADSFVCFTCLMAEIRDFFIKTLDDSQFGIDVLRIWDSLFADKRRFDFLIYLCCAMLISRRDEILRNDFPNNMKLVQNLGNIVDLQMVLAKARELSSLPS